MRDLCLVLKVIGERLLHCLTTKNSHEASLSLSLSVFFSSLSHTHTRKKNYEHLQDIVNGKLVDAENLSERIVGTGYGTNVVGVVELA